MRAILGKTGLALALGAALLGAAGASAQQVRPKVSAVDVNALPVMLNPDQPDQRRVGELTYAGGLTLRSANPEFGGISGLVVGEDGATFLAMSDRGAWFTGSLQFDEGLLSGVSGVETAPMLDWRGQAIAYGSNDSEGLAWADGSVYVSFEGFHRIWRYSLPALELPSPIFRQTAIAIESFEGLDDQPSNGGIEALASLPDGRLLALSEDAFAENGDGRAWLVKDGGAAALSYVLRGNFVPTDATALPNGDVLVLERQFSLLGGVAMRLRHVEAASIVPGARLDGTLLAELTPPRTVDNMEALAVVAEGDGAYRIYIASDDNFNVLQRTLLLSFLWSPQ